jgi:hypothetical protein
MSGLCDLFDHILLTNARFEKVQFPLDYFGEFGENLE